MASNENTFFYRSQYVITPPGTATDAAWATGFPLRDNTLIKASGTASTTVAGVSCTSAGVKHTYVAKYTVPVSTTVAPKFRARVRWQVTTAWTGTGGPPKGRFNFDVQKSGAAIQGLAKGVGAAQLLNAIATFTDANIATSAGAQATYNAGADTLDLRFEFEVTTVSTTDTQAPAVLLNHDPATAGSELIVEVDL